MIREYKIMIALAIFFTLFLLYKLVAVMIFYNSGAPLPHRPDLRCSRIHHNHE